MRHRSPGAAPLVCAAAVLLAPFFTSPPQASAATSSAGAGLSALAPPSVAALGGATFAAADTDSVAFPFVEHVRICAQNFCEIRSLRPICPTDSIEVRIDGHFPNDCYSLQRVDVIPFPSTGMS